MPSKSLIIPFFQSLQTPEHPEGVDCLEMSLKMILGYLMPEKDFSEEELATITAKKPEKGSWEMPFSIWFANYGLEVKHYSTFDYKSFQQKGIEYIRDEYGDEVATWQLANTDVEAAKSQVAEYLEKIDIVQKKPTIDDIIKEMEDGFVIRALVDSGYLNDSDEYLGHSVVVVGYDDDSIWFHDPGLPAFENRKVSRKKFQEAMDKFGGEMDAIKKVHSIQNT